MKQLSQILPALLLLFMLSHCATQKQAAYEFPAAMPLHVQTEYAKQCDKGKALYDINCARCHSAYIKKKEIIPDFNDSQIEAYRIRVLNDEHETNLTEMKMTAEELAYILTFLSYKKKNTAR